MKQSLSIYILMLQSIRNKLAAILVFLIAADCTLFTLTANKYLWMEDIITIGRLNWVFSLSLLALTIVLSTSMAGSSRQTYTLQRLALPGRKVFSIQTMVNLTAFFLLWTVQLLTVLLLCKIYLSRQLSSPDHSLDFCQQSVFLVFYRSTFLHNLFPMESVTRWLRNMVFLYAMALYCAKGACRQQTERLLPAAPFLIAAMMIMGFYQDIGHSYVIFQDVTFILVPVICILSLYLHMPKEGLYQDHENCKVCSDIPEESAASPEELEVMK